MSVTKHAKSPFYQIEFQLDGHTFRGTSKTRNKKEAEAIERKWKADALIELEDRKRTGNAPLTLSVAAGRYMTEVMQGKSSEADAYRTLQRLIKFIGGNTLMSVLSDGHVASYIAARKAEVRYGRKKYKDKRPMGTVSNATINREVAVLKRLFFRARRTWKVTLPNEPDWRGHHLKEPNARVREFTVEETNTLFDGIRDDYLPWFEFALLSGLRLDETLLKWSEVDWQAGKIITTGKDDRRIVAELSPTVRALLEGLKGHHPVFVFTYVARATRKQLKIVRGQRYPLTYAGIQTQWERVKKKHGLTNIRIHDIRHDAATKTVRATGDIRIASKQLNHSSIAVTARYAHVLGSEVANAMELVAQSRKNSRACASKEA